MLNIPTSLIKDVANIYDLLQEKFKEKINLNKKESYIGGSYYGGTELFQTRGTFFERELDYVTIPESGPSHRYNMGFKVGGQHYKEFESFKEELIHNFHIYLMNVKKEHGFINNVLRTKTETVGFITEDWVSYGTNFSIYCGIQIIFAKHGNNKSVQLRNTQQFLSN